MSFRVTLYASDGTSSWKAHRSGDLVLRKIPVPPPSLDAPFGEEKSSSIASQWLLDGYLYIFTLLPHDTLPNYLDHLQGVEATLSDRHQLNVDLTTEKYPSPLTSSSSELPLSRSHHASGSGPPSSPSSVHLPSMEPDALVLDGVFQHILTPVSISYCSLDIALQMTHSRDGELLMERQASEDLSEGDDMLSRHDGFQQHSSGTSVDSQLDSLPFPLEMFTELFQLRSNEIYTIKRVTPIVSNAYLKSQLFPYRPSLSPSTSASASFQYPHDSNAAAMSESEMNRSPLSLQPHKVPPSVLYWHEPTLAYHFFIVFDDPDYFHLIYEFTRMLYDVHQRSQEESTTLLSSPGLFPRSFASSSGSSYHQLHQRHALSGRPGSDSSDDDITSKFHQLESFYNDYCSFLLKSRMVPAQRQSISPPTLMGLPPQPPSRSSHYELRKDLLHENETPAATYHKLHDHNHTHPQPSVPSKAHHPQDNPLGTVQPVALSQHLRVVHSTNPAHLLSRSFNCPITRIRVHRTSIDIELPFQFIAPQQQAHNQPITSTFASMTSAYLCQHSSQPITFRRIALEKESLNSTTFPHGSSHHLPFALNNSNPHSYVNAPQTHTSMQSSTSTSSITQLFSSQLDTIIRKHQQPDQLYDMIEIDLLSTLAHQEPTDKPFYDGTSHIKAHSHTIPSDTMQQNLAFATFNIQRLALMLDTFPRLYCEAISHLVFEQQEVFFGDLFSLVNMSIQQRFLPLLFATYDLILVLLRLDEMNVKFLNLFISKYPLAIIVILEFCPYLSLSTNLLTSFPPSAWAKSEGSPSLKDALADPLGMAYKLGATPATLPDMNPSTSGMDTGQTPPPQIQLSNSNRRGITRSEPVYGIDAHMYYPSPFDPALLSGGTPHSPQAVHTQQLQQYTTHRQFLSTATINVLPFFTKDIIQLQKDIYILYYIRDYIVIPNLKRQMTFEFEKRLPHIAYEKRRLMITDHVHVATLAFASLISTKQNELVRLFYYNPSLQEQMLSFLTLASYHIAEDGLLPCRYSLSSLVFEELFPLIPTRQQKKMVIDLTAMCPNHKQALSSMFDLESNSDEDDEDDDDEEEEDSFHSLPMDYMEPLDPHKEDEYGDDALQSSSYSPPKSVYPSSNDDFTGNTSPFTLRSASYHHTPVFKSSSSSPPPHTYSPPLAPGSTYTLSPEKLCDNLLYIPSYCKPLPSDCPYSLPPFRAVCNQSIQRKNDDALSLKSKRDPIFTTFNELSKSPRHTDSISHDEHSERKSTDFLPSPILQLSSSDSNMMSPTYKSSEQELIIPPPPRSCQLNAPTASDSPPISSPALSSISYDHHCNVTFNSHPNSTFETQPRSQQCVCTRHTINLPKISLPSQGVTYYTRYMLKNHVLFFIISLFQLYLSTGIYVDDLETFKQFNQSGAGSTLNPQQSEALDSLVRLYCQTFISLSHALLSTPHSTPINNSPISSVSFGQYSGTTTQSTTSADHPVASHTFFGVNAGINAGQAQSLTPHSMGSSNSQYDVLLSLYCQLAQLVFQFDPDFMRTMAIQPIQITIPCSFIGTSLPRCARKTDGLSSEPLPSSSKMSNPPKAVRQCDEWPSGSEPKGTCDPLINQEEHQMSLWTVIEHLCQDNPISFYKGYFHSVHHMLEPYRHPWCRQSETPDSQQFTSSTNPDGFNSNPTLHSSTGCTTSITQSVQEYQTHLQSHKYYSHPVHYLYGVLDSSTCAIDSCPCNKGVTPTVIPPWLYATGQRRNALIVELNEMFAIRHDPQIDSESIFPLLPLDDTTFITFSITFLSLMLYWITMPTTKLHHRQSVVELLNALLRSLPGPVRPTTAPQCTTKSGACNYNYIAGCPGSSNNSSVAELFFLQPEQNPYNSESDANLVEDYNNTRLYQNRPLTMLHQTFFRIGLPFLLYFCSTYVVSTPSNQHYELASECSASKKSPPNTCRLDESGFYQNSDPSQQCRHSPHTVDVLDNNNELCACAKEKYEKICQQYQSRGLPIPKVAEVALNRCKRSKKSLYEIYLNFLHDHKRQRLLIPSIRQRLQHLQEISTCSLPQTPHHTTPIPSKSTATDAHRGSPPHPNQHFQYPPQYHDILHSYTMNLNTRFKFAYSDTLLNNDLALYSYCHQCQVCSEHFDILTPLQHQVQEIQQHYQFTYRQLREQLKQEILERYHQAKQEQELQGSTLRSPALSPMSSAEVIPEETILYLLSSPNSSPTSNADLTNKSNLRRGTSTASSEAREYSLSIPPSMLSIAFNLSSCLCLSCFYSPSKLHSHPVHGDILRNIFSLMQGVFMNFFDVSMMMFSRYHGFCLLIKLLMGIVKDRVFTLQLPSGQTPPPHHPSSIGSSADTALPNDKNIDTIICQLDTLIQTALASSSSGPIDEYNAISQSAYGVSATTVPQSISRHIGDLFPEAYHEKDNLSFIAAGPIIELDSDDDDDASDDGDGDGDKDDKNNNSNGLNGVGTRHGVTHTTQRPSSSSSLADAAHSTTPKIQRILSNISEDETNLHNNITDIYSTGVPPPLSKIFSISDQKSMMDEVSHDVHCPPKDDDSLDDQSLAPLVLEVVASAGGSLSNPHHELREASPPRVSGNTPTQPPNASHHPATPTAFIDALIEKQSDASNTRLQSSCCATSLLTLITEKSSTSFHQNTTQCESPETTLALDPCHPMAVLQQFKPRDINQPLPCPQFASIYHSDVPLSPLVSSILRLISSLYASLIHQFDYFHHLYARDPSIMPAFHQLSKQPSSCLYLLLQFLDLNDNSLLASMSRSLQQKIETQHRQYIIYHNMLQDDLPNAIASQTQRETDHDPSQT